MSKNVLIIRFSALGDVAISLPLIRSLVEKYPEVHFTFLTKSFVKELFEEVEGENFHVIGADVRNQYKGIRGLIRLYKDEDLRKIDTVCDLHRNSRSIFLGFLMWLSGAKIYHIDKQRRARKKLVRRRNKIMQPLKPVLNQYKEVFEKAGFFHLSAKTLSAELKNRYAIMVEEKFGPKTGRWIGIAPFAKHQGKIYPIKQMEEVVAYFVALPDCRLFMFGGGRSEMAVFEQWQQRYPSITVASGQGLTTDLAVLSKMDVLLTMDSANMHLASMVGTQTVSVWGATHHYSGFYGHGQKPENMQSTAEELSCRPCSIYGSKPCYRGDYACMTSIQSAQIIEKIERILSSKEIVDTSSIQANPSLKDVQSDPEDTSSSFHKRYKIHPQYASLMDFITHLDSLFDQGGRSIYKSRNEIKVFELNGMQLNVKSYKKPIWINQVVYAHIRMSKARRSYENALRLSEMGYDTPFPIGYLDCLSCGLLSKSYYVSTHSSYRRSLIEFSDNSAVGDRRDVVEALGRYVARLHQSGILHKDLSCGNILFDKDDQGIHFLLVDINRMSFQKIGLKKGLQNMERLRGSERFFKLLSDAYSAERGCDATYCYNELLRYNRRSVNRFSQRFYKKWRRHYEGCHSVGVILWAENASDRVKSLLQAYADQTRIPDEVWVIDANSSSTNAFSATTETNGFNVRYLSPQKENTSLNNLMNEAIQQSSCEYLIFMTQDDQPSRDWVERHLKEAKKGYCLLGECSSGTTRCGWVQQVRSLFVTPVFNLSNTSCWRSDLLTVCGFNTHMKCYGQDAELAARLLHLGMRFRSNGLSNTCRHLPQTSSYSQADRLHDRAITEKTRKSKLIVTPSGINSEERS